VGGASGSDAKGLRFFGREEELRTIAVVLDALPRARGPAAAIVLGDPGSGKTRLLAEALRRAPRIRRLEITGYEPERRVPLAAARSLVRELSRVLEHGPRLEALLLGEVDASGPELIRIFEAGHRARSTLGGAVLVADDLQWADEASLALCHYLLRAARESGDPLAVVAAARPTSDSGAFTEALGRLLGDACATIHLGPLEQEDGIRLVLDASPGLGMRRAEELWCAAGGSPFWLGILATTGGAPDAANVVGERLRAAGADASGLLAVLAIAGRPLAPDDVAAIEGWDVERVAQAVQELVRVGLAVAAGGLRISHDLIRHAAAGSIAEPQAPQIHARIAAWLERTAGDDMRLLLEAVEHRGAAGADVHDLALRIAMAPARRLLGEGGLLRLATIADQAPDALDLQEAIAVLAVELGQHGEALRRWQMLAERRVEPLQRAFHALAASESAMELHRAEEARATLVVARVAARAAPFGPERAALDVHLDAQESQVLRWLDLRKDAAGAMTERALAGGRALARESGGAELMPAGSRRAYLRAMQAAAEAATQANDQRHVLEVTGEMAALARGFDEQEHINACILAGHALFCLGRMAEAEACLRDVFEAARHRVFLRPMIVAGGFLVGVLGARGKLADAEAVAVSCAELAGRMTETSSGRVLSMPLVTAARLHARLAGGEWRGAIDDLRTAAERETDQHTRLGLHESIAIGLARLNPAGSEAEVFERIKASGADARAAACARCLDEHDLRAVDALARIGRLDQARDLLAGWDAANPAPEGARAWHRRRGAASIAAFAGEPGAAEQLEGVLREADQLGFVIEALWAGLDLGSILEDRMGATAVLRDVCVKAEFCGAVAVLRRADQELRRRGVRTWRRGTAGDGGGDVIERLTSRELEVARLAAGGVNNPEIAAALFLSRRTVERHLSNILIKVGVRNRTELAGRIGAAKT